MMPTIVTKSAIRKMINELLDDVTSGAIKANNVVDPSASQTDPGTQHKPQNKTEFNVAVKELTKDIPDSAIQRVYDSVSKLIDDTDDSKTKNENVEKLIRKTVRNILREEWEAYDAAVSAEEEASKPKEEKVDFEAIAKELGMSIAGAKQFVDKALARWKFLTTQHSKSLKARQSGDEDVTVFDPSGDLEDLDVLILKAWSDYIDLLNTSGELTPADVKLMHDHPEVALELDGFREYLSEYIMGSMVPTDKDGEKWLGKFPKDVDPNLNSDKPEGKRSGVRTYQNAPAFKGDYDWLEPEDDDAEADAEKIRRKAAKRVVKSGSQGSE